MEISQLQRVWNRFCFKRVWECFVQVMLRYVFNRALECVEDSECWNRPTTVRDDGGICRKYKWSLHCYWIIAHWVDSNQILFRVCYAICLFKNGWVLAQRDSNSNGVYFVQVTFVMFVNQYSVIRSELCVSREFEANSTTTSLVCTATILSWSISTRIGMIHREGGKGSRLDFT